MWYKCSVTSPHSASQESSITFSIWYARGCESELLKVVLPWEPPDSSCTACLIKLKPFPDIMQILVEYSYSTNACNMWTQIQSDAARRNMRAYLLIWRGRNCYLRSGNSQVWVRLTSDECIFLTRHQIYKKRRACRCKSASNCLISYKVRASNALIFLWLGTEAMLRLVVYTFGWINYLVLTACMMSNTLS